MTPSEFNFRVGRKMRQTRDAIGVKQEAIAFQAGITRSQLAAYESGLSGIPMMRAWHIARALGVRLSDLLPEQEEQNKRRRA